MSDTKTVEPAQSVVDAHVRYEATKVEIAATYKALQVAKARRDGDGSEEEVAKAWADHQAAQDRGEAALVDYQNRCKAFWQAK